MLLLLAPALALAAAPTPVVTQEVDRSEVGTEDIFVLTVRASDVPSPSSPLGSVPYGALRARGVATGPPLRAAE
jgi:hypothetical protein